MDAHLGRLIDHVHIRVADLDASRLDPDGNNIEAVDHGPARRSAASVVVTPT